MIWNGIIVALTILAGCLIGHGVYEIVFTRKPHFNAWVVRGVILLVLPVYLYLTYKYTGKIYLTKNLNLLILLFIWIQLYSLIVGYLDTRTMRRDIDAHKGDTSYITSLSEATYKHVNTWRDFQRVFGWIGKEFKAIKENKKKPKNRIKIKDGKKKKTEPVATHLTELLPIPAVNEQVVAGNRTLTSNNLKPRFATPVPQANTNVVVNKPMPRRSTVPLQQQQRPTGPVVQQPRPQRASGNLQQGLVQPPKRGASQNLGPYTQPQRPVRQPQTTSARLTQPHNVQRPQKPSGSAKNQPKIYVKK